MKLHNSVSIDDENYDDIKQYLHKKDGFHHVIVLHATTTLSTDPFRCEVMFSKRMDNVLVNMQKDNYKLLDVKISPMGNPNILGAVSGFSIVIIYE